MNPKKLNIDNMSLKNSFKKLLKKAGLKTAYDIADYHNRYILTSISGINTRNMMNIAKTLHQDTDMIIPTIIEDAWEWPNMKRVVKIFIAQPMSGRTDEDVLFERHEAINEINEYFRQNHDNNIPVYLDQYFVDEAPKDANNLWYLGHSITILSKADYIYFTGDWLEARGCNIEYEIAKAYGIRILNDKMLLNRK